MKVYLKFIVIYFKIFTNGLAKKERSKFINSLLDEYKRTPKKDLSKLARILAEILDNINHLHPFREGNGRTQREFLRLLALQKGLILNLNPINDDSVYERYMNGTINGNIELLFELIFELLNKDK